MSREEMLTAIYMVTAWKFPVRWHDGRTSAGDFDGNDLTIDVFNISPEDQRDFLETTWCAQLEFRAQHGRRPTFVFHSPEATATLYQHLFPVFRGFVTEHTVRIEMRGETVEHGPVTVELAA